MYSISSDFFIPAAGDFTFTNERLEVVEPSAPIFKAQVQVVYSRRQTHGNFTGLLNVLSPNFWITIFAFMFIFFFLFIASIKYSMPRSTIALAILDSAALIVKAFVGQGFDEDVFLKSHFGLKKTFILQLQLLSLIGAMVFWIYSGCLISFFTFSPSGPPINFIEDLKDSPMKFYLYDNSFVFHKVKKSLKEVPKSLVGRTWTSNASNVHKKVLLDLANGAEGIGGIMEDHRSQKIISESKINIVVM